MAVTRSVIAILLPSLILISSCGNNSPTSHEDVEEDVEIDVSFPNAIGMLWKYQVYDSLSHTTDTVWFSITDTATINSNELVTERREKRFAGNYYGRQYLLFRGDTLEVFEDSVRVQSNERLVFPLELGSGWTGPVTVDDTSTVTMVGQIEVPVAKFSNGSRIDRSWNLDSEGGGNWSQTWVVPDVGVVYRYRRSQLSDGGSIAVTTNQVWELIEYDLKTFGLHQFPNKVGTKWVYEEVDSTTMGPDSVVVEFDTVTITIADSGRFDSGYSYTTWEFASRNGSDTKIFVTGNHGFGFQHDTTCSLPWNLYNIFPLAVGRTWGMYFYRPVPVVVDKEPVHTPVQDFASGFYTHMSGSWPDDHWAQRDWLVPGVGITKSKRWQTGSARMNRTWTLIDYHLAD